MPAHDLDHLLARAGLPTEAEDCAITPLYGDMVLVTNIDIVTPIHDDPYIMGKIAACNATNDLFAMNATDVANFLCFLGLPFDIPEEIAVDILKGVKDFLESIGGKLNGGHTIQNDAPLIGGAAAAIMDRNKIIGKTGVKDGDILILTKPLGIQTVMATDRTLKQDPSFLEDYDISRIKNSIAMATKIMTTSNRPIPLMIHNYEFFRQVHAMTDITGFGFKRHLEEMLLNSGFSASIDNLPVIDYSPELEDLFCYGIVEGKSSEIAGAMLMAIDKDAFEDVVRAMDDEKIWWHEVGRIYRGNDGVKFAEGFHLEEFADY